MSQDTYPPSKTWSQNAHINSMEQYQKLYKQSIQDSDTFWAKVAERISWFKKWDTVSDCDFSTAKIDWFIGGELNVSYNCLDRHIAAGHADRVALIWESNNPNESLSLTYQQVLDEVQKCANVLLNLGIKKGDRVCMYLQMIPQLPIAMLACARIGAVHSVVFGAFSADSLQDRINASTCKLLITQDSAVRGNKQDIPMKNSADSALENAPSIEHVLVVKRTGHPIDMQVNRDIWWHEQMAAADPVCEPVRMQANDPLFILYTSGSTGIPKGILHNTGGYLVYASFTHDMVFDHHLDDIYWCTADIGWITGHTYLVYGPLANCATAVMFEGVPNYPDYDRYWQVVEKHKVSLFYTAPTTLRSLLKEGDEYVTKHDLSSLRLLASVGETIKEPEWLWYYNVIGNQKCPITDTWWQTETGGIMITPLPGATPTKPGAATLPFFGIEPVLLTEQGEEITGNDASGYLALKSSWPGQAHTIYADHARFKETYFDEFPGYFSSSDGARRDKDGYYWITGRVDDVLKVSGHRIGSAEVEGAIGKTEGVAEAAVVGFSHDIKGEGIHAFVTLKEGVQPSDDMIKAIKAEVTTKIGPHAKPEKVQFAPALPKTRSGKIMRRILRKIAAGDTDDIGNVSTLADPSVVDNLIKDADLFK
jgi:acetyl-CoA synthetase